MKIKRLMFVAIVLSIMFCSVVVGQYWYGGNGEAVPKVQKQQLRLSFWEFE
jgi:hypothetical protein